MATRKTVAGFADIKSAIRFYVVERLEFVTVGAGCPPLINVSDHFVAFLIERSIDETEAVDIATDQALLLMDEIERQIQRWKYQGVAPPFDRIPDQDGTLVTWRHARYEAHTGTTAPKRNIFDIYAWLGTLHEKEFHLPCLCYLRILGCDPIYLTDGGRDEGIDYIGLIKTGPLRSTAIFIQAKSSVTAFGAAEVLQEYAKYAGLPRTEKYMQYLNALGVPKSTSGAAYVYAIISNGDIRHGASTSAPKVGALLRSRRQVAEALAEQYSLADLISLSENIKIPSHPDLTSNLAPLLMAI